MPKNIITLRPGPEVGLEKPPKGCCFSELRWEWLGKAPEGTAAKQGSRGRRGGWGGNPSGVAVSPCRATVPAGGAEARGSGRSAASL